MQSLIFCCVFPLCLLNKRNNMPRTKTKFGERGFNYTGSHAKNQQSPEQETTVNLHFSMQSKNLCSLSKSFI